MQSISGQFKAFYSGSERRTAHKGNMNTIQIDRLPEEAMIIAQEEAERLGMKLEVYLSRLLELTIQHQFFSFDKKDFAQAEGKH